MPFVYGDSYGGVQGASQAATNSDRNLLMSLVAAQQQAQRMAWDQQNQQQQMGQRAGEFQAQMGLNARAQDISAKNAEEERTLREELGLMGLDAADAKIRATQDMYNSKLQQAQDEKIKQAATSGPILANRFNELLTDKKTAAEEFSKIQQEALSTEQQIAAAVSQGLIRPHKDEKNTYVPVDTSDATLKANVEKWNKELRRYNAELRQRHEEAIKADRDLQKHLSIATASGFLPADNALVYAKTGQSFPLMGSGAVNSKPVRRFTAKGGLEPRSE